MDILMKIVLSQNVKITVMTMVFVRNLNVCVKKDLLVKLVNSKLVLMHVVLMEFVRLDNANVMKDLKVQIVLKEFVSGRVQATEFVNHQASVHAFLVIKEVIVVYQNVKTIVINMEFVLMDNAIVMMGLQAFFVKIEVLIIKI
jgi:hypothetical protein